MVPTTKEPNQYFVFRSEIQGFRLVEVLPQIRRHMAEDKYDLVIVDTLSAWGCRESSPAKIEE